MNYLLKSKPKHKHWGKIISVLVLFCIFSLVIYLFPNFIRSTVLSVSKPLWLVSNSVTKNISNFFGYFTFKKHLVQKNATLNDEIARLKLGEIDYEILSKEYDDLKNLLGRQDDKSHLVAMILSKPPLSPYDTFIIDTGSSDGVLLGNKVYISDNIIIGLIKNVTPHTSLVELFSNGDLEQEATLSRTGATFILKGLGGGNLEIEVPKDTDVLWGDTFLYPTFSPSVIGSVYYIDTSSQNSFKKVYIKVSGNVFSSRYVFIEK